MANQNYNHSSMLKKIPRRYQHASPSEKSSKLFTSTNKINFLLLLFMMLFFQSAWAQEQAGETILPKQTQEVQVKTDTEMDALKLYEQKYKDQIELNSILWSGKDFKTIVQQADAFFQKKHPGLSSKDLCSGEHRDGAFVKYQRWKYYWERHLTPDGKCADLGLMSANLAKTKNVNTTQKSAGPFDNINWENISNPNYIGVQIGLGRTTSIAFHPTNANIFYVGTAQGGVWKTTDGGNTYTPIGDRLPALSVSSIVVDKNNPNTIYIAISDHVWYGPPSLGIYKSTDGGTNWQPTSLAFSFTDNNRIYWMEASPSNPNVILVACDRGLYRTTDGFQSYQQILSNIGAVTDVRFKPGDANTVYCTASNGRFYKSTNAGAAFSLITTLGSGFGRIAVTSQNPDKVYVGHDNKTLFRSTNSGSSFSAPVTLPEGNAVITFSPQNSNEILAGNFEVNRSTNDGSSFTTITNWLGQNGKPLIHVDQRNVFINPLQPNYIYWCNDGGVVRQTAGTSTFTDRSNGLLITQFYDIAVSQTQAEIVSGGSQDNGSMYRNADGRWDDYEATGDGMTTEIDPTNANIRYWCYQLGGLRRFENGTNYNISPPGEDGKGSWVTPFRIDPNNPNRIVAGYKRIYSSTNKGVSWTAISDELQPGYTLNTLNIAPSNSNRIYATENTTLFVKDVNNNSWTRKSTPAPFGIVDLEVDHQDMNTIYITVPGYQAGAKVYKSTDAGTTWTNISANLPNVPASCIELYKNTPGAMFVGTPAGVYYRDNTMTTWERYGNLPNTDAADIEIQYSSNRVVVGTHGRGIYRASLNSGTCAAPASASASTISTTSATINWTAVAGASSYYIYVQAQGGSWYMPTAGSGITTTSYNLTGLTANTLYTVDVYAVCPSGNFAKSFTFTTTSASTCAAPASASASNISTTSATINWTASTGASSYYIYVQAQGGSWYMPTAGSGITTTSYNLTGLTANTLYTVDVYAVCPSGNFAKSFTFTTTSASTCAAPASASASNISTTSATINWTAVAGASSYYIYVQAQGGSWYIPTAGSGITTTSYNLTGLTANTLYTVDVYAVCPSGSFAKRFTFTTTSASSTCAAPASASASNISTTSATINWTASTGASSYYIYVLAQGGSWYIPTAGTGITTTSYNLTGLTANTLYTVDVYAVCPSGSFAKRFTFTTTSASFSATKCYRFNIRHSGKVMEVGGNSTVNGGNVQQWDWLGSKSQVWRVKDIGSGLYQIVNGHSGRVLDVSGVSTAAGANVQQWDWLNANNQKWKLTRNTEGYYVVTALHSGQALDVAGAGTQNGANITQWSVHNGLNQQFQIVETTCPAGTFAAVQSGSTLTEQTHRDGSKVVLDRGNDTGYLVDYLVYPNPANEIVNIELDAVQFSEVEITITDLSGKVVQQTKFESATKSAQIAINGIGNGQYLIQVKAKNHRAVVKKLAIIR